MSAGVTNKARGQQGGLNAVLTVSQGLYSAFELEDFYTFLFGFLGKHAKAGAFRDALRDQSACRALWDGMFYPECDTHDLALRHAYVLGARLSGGGDEGGSISTMQMKSSLDNWGHIAFSAFDQEGI